MGNANPDASAFDLAGLFREHSPGLAGAVRGTLGQKADVQEVLQDAFLRAWEARDVGARHPNPVAWVFVITLNLARDLRRVSERRGRAVDLDEVNAVELLARESEPDASMEEAEALHATRAAIHRLGESEREVFLLRAAGDLSFQAIADSLSIPVGTAKTRMRAALRALRHELRAYSPASGDRGLSELPHIQNLKGEA